MPNAVELFIADCSAAEIPQLTEHWLSRMAVSEQQRYQTINRDARRREWLTGRALACEALASTLGHVEAAALRSNPGGGLVYKAAPLHLSLSHSHGLVTLALAPVPVGVDLERVQPRGLVKRVAEIFTAAETACITRAHGQRRLELFYRHWTLKEAYCKAAGVPLGTALREAEFDLERGACHLPASSPTGGWQFLSARLADHWYVALAVQDTATALPLVARCREREQWRTQALHEPVRLSCAAH